MNKKIKVTSFVLLILFFVTGYSEDNLVKKNFDLAENQYTKMLKVIGESELLPRTTGKDGSLVLVKSDDWTSGFFPGSLWYMYEFTNDNKWKDAASSFTKKVEQEQYDSTTHDVGFMMYCSYGNGFRLTGNEDYKKVLLQSAKTLISRFNPKVGCIKSWDHHKKVWQFPVIIDNMMNLELLFWSAKKSGDSTFYKIAVSHANTTMKNHFRDDYSTWHVVNYDTTSGEVISKITNQGYSDESCWARGQSWSLYGFTMCYRETKDTRYLEHAENIATYILTNKNLPDDLIPYWDYNAPNIPDEERDASAGAIMASALYELSTYSDKNGKKYKEAADKILNNLSSENYISKEGENNYFILMHSVGAKPKNSEVDVPLVYADYYFLEANLRKQELEKN